jgi:hypothetical protein
MTKQTLGKLKPDAFGMLDLPVIPADIIAGYRALPDLTGMVSDVLDELGIVGAIPASVLKPVDPNARLVGRSRCAISRRRSPFRRRWPPAYRAWAKSRRIISPNPATCW